MIDIITTPSFNLSKYIKWKDIQRSPYSRFSSYPEERKRAEEWDKKDDERLMLIALERYAEDLKNLYETK